MRHLKEILILILACVFIVKEVRADEPNEYIERIRYYEIILEFIENENGDECYIVKYKSNVSEPICEREPLHIENRIDSDWLYL